MTPQDEMLAEEIFGAEQGDNAELIPVLTSDGGIYGDLIYIFLDLVNAIEDGSLDNRSYFAPAASCSFSVH